MASNSLPCRTMPGSCANPVTTSGTPVISAAVSNACQGTGGYGVVGCLEYVRVRDTVAAGAVENKTIFPKAGEVQPIGILDSRSDDDVYLENPKVGGSDSTPDYDGPAGEVFPRSWRIQDQDEDAWRAGINLVGGIAVPISTTVKLTFDIRNIDGAAGSLAEFYWLFLRIS